jgi:integrase
LPPFGSCVPQTGTDPLLDQSPFEFRRGANFGLRISECLALKWSDMDWLSGKLSIERGIVKQRSKEWTT